MTADLKELIERLREYGDEPYDVSTGEIAEWMHKAADALEADLCAVVKPLEWSDRRNSVYQAGDYQVCLNASPHHYALYWRVRKNEKVICKKIKGLDKAKAWAQLHHKDSILSTLTIRSASDVAAEARAVAIEAAALECEQITKPTLPPSYYGGRGGDVYDAGQSAACKSKAVAIRALHDTDTLAAIERIKEQARKEERERLIDTISLYPQPHSNRIIAAIKEDE